jgi:thymidylate synthase ThyX
MQENYESFSDAERKLLAHFVTNTEKSIFALRNLPEVVKGALFSRYSRSGLGLRSLLLKEFIQNEEEMAFEAIAGKGEGSADEGQQEAIRKAQNFYDRILDGYGDDSIGELGGAHLACENISILSTKVIEDRRIGGSPLEKSTRYIYFDQKVNGEYLFYREPVLMTSSFRDLYLSTCNMLFDTYSRLIRPLTTFMEAQYPKEPEISQAAWTASIRAKVLDTIRGLLPCSTKTNMGLFGNGRFFEYLIQKLLSSNLSELREIGKRSQEELSKVIPSFVRRAESTHRHFLAWQQFYETMQKEIHALAVACAKNITSQDVPGVTLVSYDKEGIYKIAAALLFESSRASLSALTEYVKTLPSEALNQILDAAVAGRKGRRHKSPRALEHANCTFEMLTDIGSWRDLQRHRIATTEHQLFTCRYGYYVPEELYEAGLQAEYQKALEDAKAAYDTIAATFPREAQYIVPLAYNVRWYFAANLREIQWMTELRSAAAGHPSYRQIAQNMVKELIQAEPRFQRFFQFVDFADHKLGRLGQETRQAAKKGLA